MAFSTREVISFTSAALAPVSSTEIFSFHSLPALGGPPPTLHYITLDLKAKASSLPPQTKTLPPKERKTLKWMGI